MHRTRFAASTATVGRLAAGLAVNVDRAAGPRRGAGRVMDHLLP